MPSKPHKTAAKIDRRHAPAWHFVLAFLGVMVIANYGLKQLTGRETGLGLFIAFGIVIPLYLVDRHPESKKKILALFAGLIGLVFFLGYVGLLLWFLWLAVLVVILKRQAAKSGQPKDGKAGSD